MGGLFTHSVAILSDSVHDLGDAISIGISYFLEKKSKKNLKIDTNDVVEYCKNKILNKNCNIYKQGKNCYCEVDNIKITVNSYSYTIIKEHTIF